MMTEITECNQCKAEFEDHPFWQREIAHVYQKEGSFAAKELLREKLEAYHEEHSQ